MAQRIDALIHLASIVPGCAADNRSGGCVQPSAHGSEIASWTCRGGVLRGDAGGLQCQTRVAVFIVAVSCLCYLVTGRVFAGSGLPQPEDIGVDVGAVGFIYIVDLAIRSCCKVAIELVVPFFGYCQRGIAVVAVFGLLAERCCAGRPNEGISDGQRILDKSSYGRALSGKAVVCDLGQYRSATNCTAKILRLRIPVPTGSLS